MRPAKAGSEGMTVTVNGNLSSFPPPHGLYLGHSGFPFFARCRRERPSSTGGQGSPVTASRFVTFCRQTCCCTTQPTTSRASTVVASVATLCWSSMARIGRKHFTTPTVACCYNRGWLDDPNPAPPQGGHPGGTG